MFFITIKNSINQKYNQMTDHQIPLPHNSIHICDTWQDQMQSNL